MSVKYKLEIQGNILSDLNVKELGLATLFAFLFVVEPSHLYPENGIISCSRELL